MSTIKSSNEHLTLNADGSSKDIKFQANGVEKASIDSSGNLTVSGNITGGNNGSVFLLDSAGQKSGQIETDSSSANALNIDADPDNSAADSYTAFRIDNSEKMRIANSGNVGIGATSPSTSLHLKDNATAANTKLTVERSSLGYTGGYAASHCGSVTNNEFEIHTNNTLRVNIDSTGRVTMPSQPCVSARASYTDIPINTVTVITLDNERFDIGSNLASSTFTAPVTGKYLFTYTIYFSNVDTAATSLGVQTVTSNRQYENWFAPDHIANTDFYYTATSSQIADMDANDTLQFKAYIGGGSTQTDVHADSQISIILIA